MRTAVLLPLQGYISDFKVFSLCLRIHVVEREGVLQMPLERTVSSAPSNATGCCFHLLPHPLWIRRQLNPWHWHGAEPSVQTAPSVIWLGLHSSYEKSTSSTGTSFPAKSSITFCVFFVSSFFPAQYLFLSLFSSFNYLPRLYPNPLHIWMSMCTDGISRTVSI